MKKKKGWKTADELMAELEANPDYQRRRGEKEERRKVREAAWAVLEAPVLADLNAHGFDTESLYSLANHYAPLPYPLVEILLDWIAKVSDHGLLEAMIRHKSLCTERTDT